MNSRTVMKPILVAVGICAVVAHAQEVQVTAIARNGAIQWTNSALPAICNVEWAPAPTGTWSRSWADLTGIVVTNALTSRAIPMYFRVVSVADPIGLGLVLYLPFPGDANDATTNGNNGIVEGALLAPDRMGIASNAYYFDGSGTQIRAPDSASLHVTNVTLSFWFFMETYDTVREFVNKFGGSGNIGFGTEMGGDGKMHFRLSPNGTLSPLYDCVSATSFSTGVWYHVAGTYDGATLVWYVNGILDNTAAGGGDIFLSTDDLRIGRYGYDPTWKYHGRIDEVAVWNRALGSNEVQMLYQFGGKPR